MDANHAERRRFTRVHQDRAAHLSGPKGRFDARVLDISLNGAMLQIDGDWEDNAAERYRLEVEVAPSARVEMHLRKAHGGSATAGFCCEHIELDCLEHLRRLLEIETGEPRRIYREYQQLSVAEGA